MSALVGYYEAQANDRNAAADLAQAQARQVQVSTGQIGQDADAKRASLGAQTNLANLQASTIVPESKAGIAQKEAQTDAVRTQTSLAGPQFDLDAAAKTASTNATNAQTAIGATPYDPEIAKTIAGQLPGGSIQGLLDFVQQQARRQLPNTSGVFGGAEKGAIIKPMNGKKNPNGKPGKTDTVPMMLAPGEAVLNAGAVEHMGESTIHHMNKMGLLRTAAKKELNGHFRALHNHMAKARDVQRQAARGGGSKAAG